MTAFGSTRMNDLPLELCGPASRPHFVLRASVRRHRSSLVSPRWLRSIRPTRARRPFDASVDHTEARNAPVGELFFLLLKTIGLARGGSPCGRGATPRRSWVAVIRIKTGAGSIGDSYWIPTRACPHSLMRPQGPGDSPGCDVGGATAGARRRPRYRRTRRRYLGILKSKYVSLIAPGPNLPGQPTGEPARDVPTQRRHSMPMIGDSSRKSCQ
jgi:hypothetical protein